MAEVPEKETEEEGCADTCVIDLSKMKGRTQGGDDEAAERTLILLTRGTYGHHDDGFSAIQVGNALLAEEEGATMLLLDDGVYFAARDQNPTALGLPNNINYIEDFLDLGGHILALDGSLSKRGLSQEDLVEGVEIITSSRMVKEIENHRASVTF
ncbi:MAG: DsrE family protein [Dehalococcoidia bacterium]